ncbi:MAG: 3TM-type holin [Paraglaciecola polaris]|uniref:3TM-type holin n=1 Tax=Paraglaciecola polaris TaxID=222814 RepID=UPI0030029A87
MSIADFIAGIFKPAADLVDNVHTSTEEKLVQQNVLATIQNQVTAKLIELESQILTAKANIITAEANGQSWMQRSWRPITMLTFLMLVVLDSFGWLANPLAKEAWTLLQIGLGGYVVGRSWEKTVKKIKG